MSSDPAPGARLRALLARDEVLVAPGAHDPLSARLIEQCGFDVVYLGGYAVGAGGWAIPDHSLITMTELVEVARRVTAAVDVPVIADLDDGGGTPLNVIRTVRLAEQAGLAAVHVEDVLPGKHFPGVPERLLDLRAYRDLVHAAVDARRSEAFVVIARSDATTLEAQLERASAAQDVGADMVFLPHLRARDVSLICDSLSVPLAHLAHPKRDLGDLGVKVLLHPGITLFAAYRAARAELVELAGTGAASVPDVAFMEGFNDFIGTSDAQRAAGRYGLVRDGVRRATSTVEA